MSRLAWLMLLAACTLLRPAMAEDDAEPVVVADDTREAGTEDADAEAAEEPQAETAEKTEEKLSRAEFIELIKTLDESESSSAPDARARLIDAGDESVIFYKTLFTKLGKKKRVDAVDVLRQIGTRKARLLLAMRAVHDKYRPVRKDAAAALRKIGSGAEARGYILEKATSEHKGSQKRAARAICNIADPVYVDELIERTELALAKTQVNYKISRNTGNRTATMRRVTRVGGTDGGGVSDTVELPIQMPSTTVTESSTWVWSLATVTGEDFGTDMSRYKQWWKDNRAEFTFPDLDREE